MDFAVSCMGCLGIFSIFTLVVIVGCAVRGFVIAKLWLWFIAPVFGLPALSLTQAIGISMFVSLFMYSTHTPANKEEKSAHNSHVVGQLFISPWIILGTAYLFKLWFM